MTLTAKEARAIVRLLGKFQDHLEGLIDAATVDGKVYSKIDGIPVLACAA